MRFLKHSLCVQRNTCNNIVYGELRAYLLETDITVRIVKCWIGLVSRKLGKLANVMHQCLMHVDTAELYTTIWLKDARSVLNNSGMSGVWLAQKVPNSMWLGKAVEQRLKDLQITQWYGNIVTHSLCSNYIFKNVFGREDYLNLKLKQELL